MVNECYLASHSWDTLFFKLQNFKETHLNSLSLSCTAYKFCHASAQPRVIRAKQSLAHAEEKKRKKKKSNPNVWRSCLTSGSVLLSFFRTEVLSCSWIQNVDCPLELLLPSCMTIINPQTDWSLLLHFWIEVKLLSENLQKKRKRKEKSIFTRSSRQERKANHPLYPFSKKEILHHAANFKFLSKQHALLHL